MDLNRMKKLAGLLRENVEGEEQEVNEAANQKTVDFLVQKVSEDSRFKKMDVLMSKLGGGNGPIVKKVQITMNVPVEFIWDEGFESSYNIDQDAYAYIESSVEKSPAFKTAKKEMDTQIKQFIKDSENLVKEIAKKHNTKLDAETLSAVWNTLFIL
jgi:hypothetical protein